MYYNPDYLEFNNPNMSEGDYVVKIWADIIEGVFRDDQLAVKWGETVSVYSAEVKNMGETSSSRKKIGDKLDFRIVIKIYNIDLLNGEVASNTTVTKYFHDNRKLIRPILPFPISKLFSQNKNKGSKYSNWRY
ncbi:hypothetical protein EDC94DRAFT_597529 [Helicostylum pulchrum]|nr:hypothetical protein EDC94DRAFT_597529 [Helicostylum pulchrum]